MYFVLKQKMDKSQLFLNFDQRLAPLEKFKFWASLKINVFVFYKNFFPFYIFTKNFLLINFALKQKMEKVFMFD